MLTVRITSFSFHGSGIPKDPSGNGGGFVFDCRCLPNPGRIPDFMRYTGRDPEVIAFLGGEPSVEAFLISVYVLIDIAVESYAERRFTNLAVCFGCTGGLHRSVYCAEKLAARLRGKGIAVRLEHRELGILP